MEAIRGIDTPSSVHGIGAPGTIEQPGLLGDVPDSSLENSLSEGSASSFTSYQISGRLPGHSQSGQQFLCLSCDVEGGPAWKIKNKIKEIVLVPMPGIELSWI